jgi:P-type conjugative transfer protein TrbJ
MKTVIGYVAVLLLLTFGHTAQAQLAVIDPANLIENILSATYELQAVNNQLQQLQHETQMLQNDARNLTPLNSNVLAQLRTTLATTTQLLQQSSGLAYSTTPLNTTLDQLYPAQYSAQSDATQMVNDARSRAANTRAATQTAMRLQAQANDNMAADTNTLSALVANSQSAVGLLQATQATNQLLALHSRQSMQEQQLRIAHDRADAAEQARIAEMALQTQEMQRRFLSNGTRYTAATTVDFYSP